MKIIRILQKHRRLQTVFAKGVAASRKDINQFIYKCFHVDKLTPNAKVGMANGIANDELRVKPFYRKTRRINCRHHQLISFFKAKRISCTNFGVWPRLSCAEAIFRIGKNGQVLETFVKAIVGSKANSQMLTRLVAENWPNRAKKVNRIESALIGMAEQNAGIGFGLKHELPLFLGVEAP